MIHVLHSHDRRPFIRWAAFTCAFAILLVGTLQATHFHKEWAAPLGHKASVNQTLAKDAQCVFCAGSHAPAGLPLQAVAAHLQSVSAPITPEVVARAASVEHRAFTIRPPPAA